MLERNINRPNEIKEEQPKRLEPLTGRDKALKIQAKAQEGLEKIMKDQYQLACRKRAATEIDRCMHRYRRFVIRYNEPISEEFCGCPGLKEYGLPNVAYELGEVAKLDKKVTENFMHQMLLKMQAPDLPFIEGAECWFTQTGFELMAEELWELIIECERHGYTTCMYCCMNFPNESILYADEHQIVIDRDKLR